MVCPGETLALVAGDIPVVVDWVKSRPLSDPCLLIGREGCAGERTVSVAGDDAESVLLARFLDASQPLSLLLPSTAIAASDFSTEPGLLEGRVEDLQEVGGLLAIRLHGGIGGAVRTVSYNAMTDVVRAGLLEIRLVQETNNVNSDAHGLVVLDVLDNLVCISLPPITGGAAGVSHSAEVTAVKVSACMERQLCSRPYA